MLITYCWLPLKIHLLKKKERENDELVKHEVLIFCLTFVLVIATLYLTLATLYLSLYLKVFLVIGTLYFTIASLFLTVATLSHHFYYNFS